MGQQTFSPWDYYQGWDVYQNLLVQAIKPLTTEQLELRISPNLRSIGLLAKHIVRTRATWLHNVMGEGDTDVVAIAGWEYEGEVPSTAELVRGLEVTFRAWQQCLERWTPEDMTYVFKGEHLGEPYALTRQWIVWHVIEHDLHHGGELSFSLGAHGLSAPDI
ncbi:MAG TPA: DinB family protein [Ktedonobacteraceae bacterium]|nr:DinB family protein [Ktedonobacteraceae bacterium]